MSTPVRRKWYFEITSTEDEGSTYYRWSLIGKDGPIASSPRCYSSEAEARSAIANAKTAMHAARFARVEVKHADD